MRVMGRAVWGGEGGSPMGPYWPSSMPRRTSTWVIQSTAMKPAVMAKKSIGLQWVNQGWTLLALHHPADPAGFSQIPWPELGG